MCVSVSFVYICNRHLLRRRESGEALEPKALHYSCIIEHVGILCSVSPETHFETDFKLVAE